MANWFMFRIPLDYVLNINAYDVNNADALVQQTQKIETHGNKHAHQITHVIQIKTYFFLNCILTVN